MALLLQDDTCNNCQTNKIVFSDCTGLYINNGTGYGSPNLAIADITSATVAVIYPNGTTSQSFDITTAVIANAQGNYSREFSPSDFGLESFEDGWGQLVYTVTGTVSGNSVSYSVTKKIFWSCDINCCIQKAAVTAALEDKACCDDCSKANLFLKMYTSYMSLKKALCCGNVDAVNKQWERLKKWCAGEDCGCH